MSAVTDQGCRWVQLAREAWGGGIPDWVLVLAGACDQQQSQAKVAKRIGYSAAAVSQILHHRYNSGKHQQIETVVRAVLMAEQVRCPVLGLIALAACLEHQDRVAAGVRGSEMRIRLARACPGCANHRRSPNAQ